MHLQEEINNRGKTSSRTLPNRLDLQVIWRIYDEFAARRAESRVDSETLRLQVTNLHLFTGMLTRELERVEQENRRDAVVVQAEADLTDLRESLVWFMRHARFKQPGEVEDRLEDAYRIAARVISLLQETRADPARQRPETAAPAD